jgi:Ca2+-binding EF-hand superfamily protein
MRKAITVLSILGLLACLPATASAQDGAKKKHGKKHEALLKKFDKDGDGKLSKEERAAAKEFKDKRKGEEGRGGKLRGKILRRFDKDGDHKLSDAERAALKKYLESHLKKGRRR